MNKFVARLSGLAIAMGAMSAHALTDLSLDQECNYNGTLISSGYSWNGGNYNYCELPADIAVDDTIVLAKTTPGPFATPILWVLPQVVVVGNGEVQNADSGSVDNTIIEIEAGAKIVGAIENSALVVTRGANLNAFGSNGDPIIFSSLDEGFSGKGEWGGVILSDFGVSNECNSGSDSCVMEGISQGNFYFGGDGSGTTASFMEYVVITEGGSVVDVETDGDPDPNSNSGDEINGLTLYGVDTDTTLNNIHIHDNLDDGIEFFGGDVEASRLWLTCHQDDSVDWDYGYQGKITNLSVVQKVGAEDPDHAFELASNPNNASANPPADGSVLNATIQLIGGASDVPFKLKEGTGGHFDNVLVQGYNGVDCAVPGLNHSVTFGSQIEYDCNNVGVLPPSSSASGFGQSTFWTTAQGNPGCN